MEIDLAALEADIAQLSPEDLKKQLLDAKVRQKVATKKYYNADTAKKARQKKAAILKAQAELAKTMPSTDARYKNLYEQIMAEAEEVAAEKLGENEAEDAEALVEA